MKLADLLRERLDVQNHWENERKPTPVRCFAVRLHSMGLSLREVEAVFDWLGVDRCHQAIWHWKEMLTETQSDPPTAGVVCITFEQSISQLEPMSYKTVRFGRF